MRAAVVGDPVAHSLSPALHEAAWRSLGRQGRYERRQVPSGGLAGFLHGCDPDEGWVGLSVTTPLKEEAHALAGSLDEAASLTAAVNTLIPQEGGGWRGLNTDVLGIEEALREAPGSLAVDRPALILGSGATARSSLVALERLGWRGVVLAVRGAPRAQTLALAQRLGMRVGVSRLADGLTGARTAAGGGLGAAVATLPRQALSDEAARAWGAPAGGWATPLLECAYADWPSPLALAWGQAGRPVLHGARMLLHQARAQVQAMTGEMPPQGPMEDALRAAVGED